MQVDNKSYLMLGSLLGLPEGAIKVLLRWASQFFCI